ncbi:glutamine--fructose-6-phosphate transaminase (isomerizing) [uncultured Finegoldia sp.]|uniref:glutamine--fructose-6-phosphate transaminase (isomerizing) n=1 Tax=uncultured Finegoldia sp. TaxID=328009 RepID=UPI002638E96F|nr:glutamine--fructose-6-phosphate transaminase (isomerizing) [uncultured Finegoldia sp.]
MCGIVCYNGEKSAVEVILNGLESLEYRGYDSSGISVVTDKIETVKRKGKLQNLIDSIDEIDKNANIGIGHIRWATHGEPNEINAHPQVSSDGKFSVVHNGIIENYKELKKEMEGYGYKFKSTTDTEIVVALISHYYKDSLLEAVKSTVNRLKGAYALGIVSEYEKDKLIAVRKESPLILAKCDDGIILASDIPSVLKYTRDIVYLENGDVVEIDKKGYTIYDKNFEKIDREVKTVNMTLDQASKGGYKHFMLKEINEQPEVVKETLKHNVKKNLIDFDENSLSKDELKNINKVYIVACGTAFHAGEVGKVAIEKLAKIPVITDIASEFRYNDPFIDEKTLVILISQSGETADTLAALRESKNKNATVLAVTNVVGSSIAREADKVIYTLAGPEIAVASTKAYISQLVTMIMLALDFAKKLDRITDSDYSKYIDELERMPEKIKQALKCEPITEKIADLIKNDNSMFFIGRGLDFLSVKEGALKLKEISYIHTEAFPAGELKHGSIALIEKDTPALSVITQSKLAEKTISNVQEVVTRGAKVFTITVEGNDSMKDFSEEIIFIPKTLDLLYPILSVIPEQLLGYYTSLKKGLDVDKPRNLAKSVTVE